MYALISEMWLSPEGLARNLVTVSGHIFCKDLYTEFCEKCYEQLMTDSRPQLVADSRPRLVTDSRPRLLADSRPQKGRSMDRPTDVVFA